jgi:hypothetical protein
LFASIPHGEQPRFIQAWSDYLLPNPLKWWSYGGNKRRRCLVKRAAASHNSERGSKINPPPSKSRLVIAAGRGVIRPGAALLFLRGTLERFPATTIMTFGLREGQVMKKLIKTKTNVGQPTNKLLCDRYKEVLRLRQRILAAQLAKPVRADHRVSK